MHKTRKVDVRKTLRSEPPHRSHAHRAMPSILDAIEPEVVREDIEEAVEQVVEHVVEPVDLPHGHQPDVDDAQEEDLNEITRAAESIPADSPADRADHSGRREEHPPMPPSIDDVLDQDVAAPVPARSKQPARKRGKR